MNRIILIGLLLLIFHIKVSFANYDCSNIGFGEVINTGSSLLTVNLSEAHNSGFNMPDVWNLQTYCPPSGSETRWTAMYWAIIPECPVYDPLTLDCGTFNCLDSKPIISASDSDVGCFNGCQYEYQTTIKNWENALADPQNEFLPNGLQCEGQSELASVQEYSDSPETNEQCITILGLTTCIKSNGCKTYNGLEVCSPDYTCGTYNGEVTCFQNNQDTNCGFVNGEYLCIYPEGDAIASDSPDHPANGGNGDKNESNDILDQEDITNNTQQAKDVQDTVKKAVITAQATKQEDKQNPKHTFEGIECDKEVSCTGDTILCAIARYEKKQACLTELDTSDILEITSQNPLMQPIGSIEGEIEEISVEGLISDDKYLESDQTCPAPLGFSFLGVAYSIEVTPLCDLARIVRFLLLAFTWVFVGYALSRAF